MSRHLTEKLFNEWKKSGFQKIEISGVSASATAFVCSSFIANPEIKLLLVCPDAELATSLHQDMKTFLQALPEKNLLATLEYFPGWEHSPYQGFSPSLKNRIRRLKTLFRLAQGEVRLLVTHVDALLQKCPSFENLAKRTLSVKNGDFLSREDFIQKLDLAGYQRTELVEDPGTYSFRGNIFDVFSVAYKKPLRLEFFGDELESLRFFDASSQRSAAETLASAEIIPCTDWGHDAASIQRAKSEIKTFCDEHGVPKSSRDLLFERLESGAKDPDFDYLSPYFSDEVSSWVIDYLDGWKLALFDSLGAENRLDRMFEALKKGTNEATKNEKIIAPISKLYGSLDDFKNLEKKLNLTFDQIALGVPQNLEPQTEEELAEASNLELVRDGKVFLKLLSNADLKPQAESTSNKSTLEPFLKKALLWQKRKDVRVLFASTQSQAERVQFLLQQKEVEAQLTETINFEQTEKLQILEGAISSGFRVPKEGLVLISDSEIFGPKKQQKTKDKKQEPTASAHQSFVSSLEDLNPQDYVVHLRHGVGRYLGLTKIEVDKVEQDFLLLEYAGSDKLYLPVYRLDQVQKYLGSTEVVSLDKLGSAHFEKAKEKVKKELQEVAHKLLELYAKRAMRPGIAYSAPDDGFRTFEAEFPYAETTDQLKAIGDIATDMESQKIMDRLVCGDVGYGKTEVAMRAAYRAASDGKQVAVLVPTTVLAVQHERSFKERFKHTAFRIGVLSRFKSTKEIKEALQDLREGKLDILIGTHRLLSKDVVFKDLGLIIVDEEQRFGVEHKERLKTLKVNTDVLTLTATPIPRTLQLSLMGLRDISVINTPPVDRLSVRTYVARFEEEIIKNAIENELSRGGQVFFIHNRVQSIHAMADRIQEAVPKAKILVAHGQLDEKDLEQRMLDFYNKKADVLLCSTIIESGLDIPSANTMIINRADMFGLSQLYQLRGRVGRSQVRAYCYLMLPEEGAVSEEAKKRLEVIQRFVELGSGFKIASHDLELRGGGDILGKSQSGHIAAVGYELYMELLEETIHELRGEKVADHFDPEIKLPVTARIPEDYVPDVHQRLSLYKRLSSTTEPTELHDLELEMQDRYGKPPEDAQNLLWLIRIKQLLRKTHIKSLTAGKERAALDASEGALISPEKTLKTVQQNGKTLSITPDSKIILKKPFQTVQQLFHDIQNFLTQVAEQ